MNVIHELNREDLIHEFKQHRDYVYIQEALYNYSRCYLVSIDQDDLSKLLINSSPKYPQLPLNKYPSIGVVLSEIKENPGFLEVVPANDYRGLNGPKVKEKIEEFKLGKQTEESFIMDARQDMEREGAFYVMDGMHRLVAYAIWSDLKADKFPITVYCCTNKRFQNEDSERKPNSQD